LADKHISRIIYFNPVIQARSFPRSSQKVGLALSIVNSVRFKSSFQVLKQAKPAYNIALAKYGAGHCNFIISNIAGLVRGWTVFV
jgi:hypothetical protein